MSYRSALRAGLFSLSLVGLAQAQSGTLPDLPRDYAVTIFPDQVPLYGPDFTQWEGVNPDAPKGGALRLSAIGSYDTFSDFGLGGDTALGIRQLSGENILFDTLLTANADEPGVFYGLVAEWIILPPERDYIIFKIRDEAAFTDGSPIQPSDVIFSFQKRIDEGFPGFARAFSYIIAMQDLGDGVVRFDFDVEHEQYDRTAPFSVGTVEILPESYWQNIDLAEPLLESFLGSGPYRIGEFEAGQSLEYVRNESYWGWDHPANRGRFNFDSIEITYYGSDQVRRLALKAGDIDYMTESTMTAWMEDYQVPSVEEGVLQRRALPDRSGSPSPAQGFYFNHRVEKLQDPRVREALALAFDFPTINEDFFFGAYARAQSYYGWSDEYRAEGLPNAAERAIWEGLEAEIPEGLLDQPAYTYPVSEAAGNRDNLARAFALLSEAGYRLENGVMLQPDGEPFELEAIFISDAFERIYNRWAEGLARLGITLTPQKLEGAQWLERVSGTWDYEITNYSFSGSAFPGDDIYAYFSSALIEIPRSFGFSGVNNPAIDELSTLARSESESQERLAAIARATDRLLRHEHITVLQWEYPFSRVLYWDQLGFPNADAEGQPIPGERNAFWSLWIDPEKAASLPARQEAVFNR